MTNQYDICLMASASETGLSAGPGVLLCFRNNAPAGIADFFQQFNYKQYPPLTYSIRPRRPQVKLDGKCRFWTDALPISPIAGVPEPSGNKRFQTVVAHQLHYIKTTTTPLTIPSALLHKGGLFFCPSFQSFETTVGTFIHEPNFGHRTNFSHLRSST
jgi:hypothetical protein